MKREMRSSFSSRTALSIMLGITRPIVWGCVSPCSPRSKERRIRYRAEDADAKVVLAHDTFAETLDTVQADTEIEDILFARYESYLSADPTPSIDHKIGVPS